MPGASCTASFALLASLPSSNYAVERNPQRSTVRMHARLRYAEILLISLGLLGSVAESFSAEPATSATPATQSRQIYVDPTTGDDRANGLTPQPRGADAPVKTIARGIKLAQPGDTVHLAPAQFRESAVFYNRHGEPGKPITLDGHGAVLEGSDPLQPTDWQQVSPGTYRNDRLLRSDLLTRDTAVIGRWFFIFDGQMNHMGRTLKGPTQPLKKPEDLQPGEWTIVQNEHAFYLRIDPAKSLADYKIAAPVRSSGVVVTGDCSHLVIRNVTATHVHNDGFNIHGKTRDCRYENIASIECGDDGFSAHDDCQQVVDGFVSIGNSTGIANTGHSVSENRRVWIENCLGVDLLVLDEGFKSSSPNSANRHSLSDSVIISSAASCLSVDGSKGLTEPCSLKLDNVLVHRIRQPGQFRINSHSHVAAHRLTLLGANINATGATVELRNSIVAGDPKPEILLTAATQWRADHNWYDVGRLVIEKTSYTQDMLAQYRQATGQDLQSRWEPLAIENGRPRDAVPGIGADETKLPTRPKQLVPDRVEDMQTIEADVVVVGATPGGLGAAISAARLGAKSCSSNTKTMSAASSATDLPTPTWPRSKPWPACITSLPGVWSSITSSSIKACQARPISRHAATATTTKRTWPSGYSRRCSRAKAIAFNSACNSNCGKQSSRTSDWSALCWPIVHILVARSGSTPRHLSTPLTKAIWRRWPEFLFARAAKGAASTTNRMPAESTCAFGNTQPGPGSTGEPDHATEAYCFRFHVTNLAANRVPIEKPKDFNREDYRFELADIRSGKATQFRHFVQLIPMPGRKFEMNSDHPHPDTGVPSESLDLAEENWAWPEASMTRRREIYDRYLTHNVGLLWLLQNDPEVPATFAPRCPAIRLVSRRMAGPWQPAAPGVRSARPPNSGRLRPYRARCRP